MSDRIKGFSVALDHDMHEEDAEKVRLAILQLKHVAGVQAEVSDLVDWSARQMVRLELGKQLMGVLYPERSK